MKKYFLNDGASQQGPFSLEELKEKNIKADTPIWYDGIPAWTTAGALEELKDIIVQTPPPFQAPKEEVKPVVAEAVATTVASATTVTAVTTDQTKPIAATSPVATKPARKKTAWVSWVLYLLVIAGVGYFIYQDMEKNKDVTSSNTLTLNAESENTADKGNDGSSTSPSTEKHETVVTNDEAVKTEPVTTDPASTTTTTTVSTTTDPPVANTLKTNVPVTTTDKAKTSLTTKAQQAEAQKLAAKKAEDEKKKLLAAQAAALKEKEYRNSWPKYVTIGQLNLKKDDDGVEAFNIPVFNGTNATLDKVTLRVDYMKKEKKVVKSETVVIYGIPPGAGLNGHAPESKKGNNIKVFITGITSRKLHFCFPENNGSGDDPYYCK